MQKVRDASLDAVKGFAIILVMLGHCIVLNHMEDGYLYDAIAAVQMPLFMAVSGYLSAGTVIASGRQLAEKLCKRAVNYLLPFFAWIALLHPLHFVERVKRVLFQLDLGLWFLMVLFLMTAALYLALWVKNCTPLGAPGLPAVLLLFAGGTGLQYLYGVSFLSPHLTVRYLPFFLAGCAARRLRQSAKFRLTHERGQWLRTALPALSGLLFLFLVFRFDLVTAHSRPEWLVQMAASGLGVCAVLPAVYGLKNGRVKRFLSFTGTYTLEIYVLHFHFARILGMEEAGLSLYSKKGMGVVLATFLMMSVLTAFFIFVLKKFWFTDFLLFGRLRQPAFGKKGGPFAGKPEH